ncbi:unnamed protein product [Amoebophrya sp. A25]|nr:unnamed protein product [Amoebophrya sp. A25]|eukprot:GSA25T00027962001.1
MKPAISIEEAKDTSTGGTAEVLETQAKETSTGAQEDESLQMEGLLLDQILGTYDASQDAAKTGDTVDQAPVMSCSIKPEEGKQGGGEAKAVKEAPETEEGQGGGEDTAAKEARDKKNARKRAREEAKKVEKQNAPKKAKK